MLDLAKLPPNQRRIMRILLRKGEMTYSDLYSSVEAVSEADCMDQTEFDKALEVLSKQGWLILTSDQRVIQKVNFRRKTGVSLPQNIWSALEAKVKQSSTPEKSDIKDSET